MEKPEILDAIRRVAEANGGTAPGAKTFEAATEIGKTEWYPHYWLRWSDALTEAGYAPNQFFKMHDEIFLVTKYIELIREIGQLPIKGHLLRKRKKAPGTEYLFPTDIFLALNL